jgi:hypothetical protein
MPRATAVLVLSILCGCATERAYEGPARAPAELALIEGAPRINAGLPLAAVIRKVDAQPVGFGYSRVTVAPGRHLLLIDCVMSTTHTTTRFEIAAEVAAGRRYVLVADSSPGNQRCGAVRLEAR